MVEVGFGGVAQHGHVLPVGSVAGAGHVGLQPHIGTCLQQTQVAGDEWVVEGVVAQAAQQGVDVELVAACAGLKIENVHRGGTVLQRPDAEHHGVAASAQCEYA